MKKYFILITSLFLLNVSQAQLFQQQYGFDRDLQWNSAAKINGTTNLFLVGNQGSFKTSIDNGATWNDYALNSDTYIDITFPSANTGFLLSNMGTLYKTTDGGSTWDSTYNFGFFPSEFLFESDTLGYCIGSLGNIFKTVNGGTIWTPLSTDGFTESLRGISLKSMGEFTVVGDSGAVLNYRNYGDSVVYDTTNANQFLLDVDFIDDSTGFACGTGATIMKSTNGGKTWSTFDYTSIPLSPSLQFVGINFISADTGFVVYANSGFRIYSTFDGGLTWNRGAYNGSYAVKKMCRMDENSIMLVGSDNIVLKSDNRGVNWFVTGNDYSMCRFLAVDTPNDSVVYTGGENGLFLKTINGGSSWTALNTEFKSGNISSLFFFNENEGFIGDNFGSIFHTTDGGVNQTLVFQNPTPIFDSVSSVNDLIFVDDSVGFAVGWNNAIYKTTDRGVNWVKKYTPSNGQYYAFNSVDFVSDSVGYVYGYGRQSNWGSRIYKTVDQGESWSFVKEFTFSISPSTMNFVNADTGYVAKYYGEYEYTYDGGTTWGNNVITGQTSSFAKITFINDSVGFANDREGYYTTTDKGITWNSVFWGNFIRHYDHQFLDETTGYFVGHEACIIKTYSNISTGLMKNNIEIPFMAYPNPANHMLNIDLGKQYNNITVHVRDVLGNYITSHEYHQKSVIKLNTEDLSSGIYLLTVKTNKGTTLVKMVKR
ncbi:MAG: hypothetical protein COB15_16060 [Flavobacteriales bacterium]|nr:MAG: hypothetical protein COB15_16060 [Flavobacteriales bacterium]